MALAALELHMIHKARKIAANKKPKIPSFSFFFLRISHISLFERALEISLSNAVQAFIADGDFTLFVRK